MNNNSHYFRNDKLLEDRIDRFKELSRIQNDSYALRYLINLGLVTHDILCYKMKLPVGVELAANPLSEEQEQQLVESLKDKVGAGEVNRLRELARYGTD
jgi:hypothetical protein